MNGDLKQQQQQQQLQPHIVWTLNLVQFNAFNTKKTQ